MNKHYYQNFDFQAEQIKYFQFCVFLLLHCAQKSPSTFSAQLIGFNETALCIFIGIMNTTMAQRYAFYHVWVRRSVVQSSVSYCSAEQCCDLRLNVRNPSVLGVDGNRDCGSHMNIFFMPRSYLETWGRHAQWMHVLLPVGANLHVSSVA